MKYLIEAYYRQVESAFQAKKLSLTCYERLKAREFEDLDELENSMREYMHSLEHADYYILLDRIDAGDEKIANETDLKKKAEYRLLMNELIAELESLTPKEEAA